MLDGRTHLVKQGWKGTGHPLKAGGRTRPVVVAQKKTLGGIGKDRDESFAFWDHLYDVAAKTIKLKLPAEDPQADSDQNDPTIAPTLHRTNTGILSNRRPTVLPTPSSSKSPSPPPLCTSIISLAKREVARRSLYSRFLRGPVLAQESLDDSTSLVEPIVMSALTSSTLLASSAQSLATVTEAVVPASEDDEHRRKVGKAARRVAKEERRKAKAARRQARAERREAKAVRREAKATKKLCKVERAAKKAAKLEKRSEKKAQVEEISSGETTTEVDISGGSGDKVDEGQRKKDKKRKRDRM